AARCATSTGSSGRRSDLPGTPLPGAPHPPPTPPTPLPPPPPPPRPFPRPTPPRVGPALRPRPIPAAAGDPARAADRGRGGGPGERVDRLLRVADHAEIIAVAGPGLEQQLLQRVDILVLINNEVPVTVPHRGRGRRMLGENRGGEFEHGFEVDQVPLAAQFLVGGIEPGQRDRTERRRSRGLGTGLLAFVRPPPRRL